MVQRGILLIFMKTFGHLSSLKPDLVCLSVGLKPEWVSNFHALFSSVDTELFSKLVRIVLPQRKNKLTKDFTRNN